MSLKDQLNDYPFAEYRCLDFISGLYAPCSNDEQQEGVRRLFRCGYCWYFAHMMQTAFHGEGTVCFAYPFGHWVWCSNNGTPYDIEGVYTGEAELLIPEYFCKEIIPAFTHTTMTMTIRYTTSIQSRCYLRLRKFTTRCLCGS